MSGMGWDIMLAGIGIAAVITAVLGGIGLLVCLLRYSEKWMRR